MTALLESIGQMFITDQCQQVDFEAAHFDRQTQPELLLVYMTSHFS